MRCPRVLLLAVAATPLIAAFAQQQTSDKQEPPAEQVFKNIQVFKGSPSSDLIPSMEFMAASLHYECSDCHDPKDYSADTQAKNTARRMILMQRDINAKNFNGRLQVTCNTCHRGSEHPMGTPLPGEVSLRHKRLENTPKVEDLFARHIAAVGNAAPVVRIGTLTSPNDETHKVETTPLEYIQAPGGKYRLISGPHKVVSDGTSIWYGGQTMGGEGFAVFSRLGRAWRGADAFAGLDTPTVAGHETNGKTDLVVVRAARPGTQSTEELYFDPTTGLLLKLVNLRRSSLGTVVSSIDYSNYRNVGGTQVPMKVVATFAGGEQWIMDFKSAKIDRSLPDSTFSGG